MFASFKVDLLCRNSDTIFVPYYQYFLAILNMFDLTLILLTYITDLDATKRKNRIKSFINNRLVYSSLKLFKPLKRISRRDRLLLIICFLEKEKRRGFKLIT